MKWFLAGVVATLLVACSAQKIEIGSRDTSSTDASSTDAPNPARPACESGPQLPIVDVWDGYIENTRFLSGSSALRVVVSHANEKLACGTVILGDRSPPPAPDPERAYPPALDGDQNQDAYPAWAVVEGFAMPFVDAPIADHVVSLELEWVEFWRPWCALQKPEFDRVQYGLDGGAFEHYACATNVRTVSQSTWPFSVACFQGDRPYSCGKAWQCPFCTCDAQSCSMQPEGPVGVPPLGMSLTFGTETSGIVYCLSFSRPLHLEPAGDGG